MFSKLHPWEQFFARGTTCWAELHRWIWDLLWHGNWQTTKGYKNIYYHIVYSVKDDLILRPKYGIMTETPTSSFYSHVVSLRGLCMCLFLAELKNNVGIVYQHNATMQL